MSGSGNGPAVPPGHIKVAHHLRSARRAPCSLLWRRWLFRSSWKWVSFMRPLALFLRVRLAWRLVLAVLLLPAGLLPKASAMSLEELAALLQVALLPRRSRRASTVASSTGAGDTPASDDAHASDNAGASDTADGVWVSDNAVVSDDPAYGTSSTQGRPCETSILAVDIGGTRTKFLLVRDAVCSRLPPAPTALIWQNADLDGPDRFDPASAPRRMRAYLSECGVDVAGIGRLAFSVPGTGAYAFATACQHAPATCREAVAVRGF